MLAITLLNVALVVAAVAIHYEFLMVFARRLAHRRSGRFAVLGGVLAALVAHALQIWLFALGYWLTTQMDGLGRLTGNFGGEFLDCLYFSFTTYTTLGYGDIEPFGPVRFLAGIEALVGLVLITWTASFLFLEMQRHWREP
ncbi:MAG: two pore domain potassium channel family protein [Cellvibrionales bacterium]|nr:two pore domain potassium channel family protein [Cellvibrionales bacterium]